MSIVTFTTKAIEAKEDLRYMYHYYYHFNIVFKGKVCMGSCAPRGVRIRLRKVFVKVDELS
jgi:hypothetical protein